MIRTGNEKRISNFLIYQLAYLTYRALNKKEEAENIEETVKPLGTILEKEEDKGE